MWALPGQQEVICTMVFQGNALENTDTDRCFSLTQVNVETEHGLCHGIFFEFFHNLLSYNADLVLGFLCFVRLLTFRTGRILLVA